MTLTSRFYVAAGTTLLLSLAACSPHHDTPAPPPTPVVVTPADTTTVAIDTAHWTYFGAQSVNYAPPTAGKFEFTSEGVKASAEATRLGGFLLTSHAYALNNRTIKVAWKVNDGGSFCNYIFSFADSTGTIYDPATNLRAFEDLNNLSTQSTVGNSVIINAGVWYYTTITTGNGTYLLTTATGNYAGANGSVIETRTGTFTRSRGRLSLRGGDPFAGTSANVIINALSIR